MSRQRVVIGARVRGPHGVHEDEIIEMKVATVSPFGWISGVDENGKQRIMYSFEVAEDQTFELKHESKAPR